MFGDYIYSPTTKAWTQRRQLINGQPLLLYGSGRKPTDNQIMLFQQIDGRLAELMEIAIAAVNPPPSKPQCKWFSRPSEFTWDELRLSEVRVEEDETFEFFFDSPTGDRIDMWPMVTFSGWRVVGSEWVC